MRERTGFGILVALLQFGILSDAIGVPESASPVSRNMSKSSIGS
jgi:hypothetical protein